MLSLWRGVLSAAVCCACVSGVPAQTVLEADGPGGTYELINSVLAPGADVVEHPECVHPQFGRHIAEVWDAELNRYVFEFYSHVAQDNDRCINFDRQRVEIKTYDRSPANLVGLRGETITYTWKFRLPAGFKPSSSFTHIHQIKAVGGDDGNPLITLTPRKGTPNKLELIHNNVTKAAVVNLSLFEGVWVECTETITVGATGSYALTITRVADGTTLLSYAKSGIMTIRPDNTFIRPKWGIYRSLDHPADLRDEAVRFAGFSIREIVTDVDRTESAVPERMTLEQNYPNPFNPSTVITYRLAASTRILLAIYDNAGRIVDVLVDTTQAGGRYRVEWNASAYAGGVYFCRLQADGIVETKKIVVVK